MNNALKNDSQNIFFTSLVLGVILAVLIFTYILMAANVVSSSYSVDDLLVKISRLKKENNSSLIELSQNSALNNVLAKSGGLSFTEIEDVRYIQKSSTSPFARK